MARSLIPASVSTRYRATHGAPTPVRQRGQALIVGLALLIVASLALYVQFSVGQTTASKQRLVNATDAAAYSAALWRARAMNYYAYSNRAIIANEVAIAQAATMVSFTRFLERFAENVDDVARYYPVVSQISAAIVQVANWVSQLTQMTARVETTARSIYIEALAASQELMFAAAHPVVLSRVAAEVARENDRRFFAFTLPTDLAGMTGDISTRYSGDDRDRLKDVVLRSLDGYSTQRDADLAELPCIFRVARRGATELIRDHDKGELERWQAYDTMSLHLARSLCRQREVMPLGWGAAEVAVDPKEELDSLDGASAGLTVGDAVMDLPGGFNADASASKTANARAYQYASDEIWVADHYRGIASVRELDFAGNETVLANSRYPVMRLGVVGWIQSAAAVGTAQSLALAAGRVEPQDRFSGRANAAIGAVSAADVYFRRPAQAVDRIEYASLYSPYWQVRLSPVPPAWRAAAMAYFQ